METPKHKLRVPRARRGAVQLLVGTRKGAFRLGSDAARNALLTTSLPSSSQRCRLAQRSSHQP